MSIKRDAQKIIKAAIQSSMPGMKVRELLFQADVGYGRIVVIAVGKAAFTMASAAYDVLRNRITAGLIVSKEGEEHPEIPGFMTIYAGHPEPNEKSLKAAETAMSMVEHLTEQDHVLFLLSGGASSLFEKSLIPFSDFISINRQLLHSGADITEINTVRKHLSAVKGGRFAALCEPAIVNTILLSDVVGNDISMVGSGPTALDKTTGDEAFSIIEKYHIKVPKEVMSVLVKDTPKILKNVTYSVIGDVHKLLESAKKTAEDLGYQTVVLSESLDCEAREAGRFIASIARTYHDSEDSIAFILGGETVVHVTGKGLGGRNQEMALSCAKGIKGLKDVCFFSVGSDGTDGPTDASGGIVDGDTAEKLRKAGISIDHALAENDSYNALKAVGALVMTGPTGTNVNDLSVLLIRRDLDIPEFTHQD